MIATQNISLSYSGKPLFKNVNIKFTAGNCYGIIGANGTGKSTFLKVLSGELEPTTGEVVITPGERMAVLRQNHFEFDSYEVLQTVIMGHKRLYEIMKENNITDNRKVGLYGLTYKENVDDFRESPALQLLDIQQRHLARPLKCYDPFLENHKIAENQFSDFDEFLKDVDMVVLMVKHDHIKHNWDRLKGKVILDCFNICPLEGVYHI